MTAVLGNYWLKGGQSNEDTWMQVEASVGHATPFRKMSDPAMNNMMKHVLDELICWQEGISAMK